MAEMVVGTSNHTNLEQAPNTRKALVQRRATPASGIESAEIPESFNASISSGHGRPLDKSNRELMESRFGGYDFSHVRIHTNAHATKSAHALGAQAYTVGRDIFFNQENYAPERKSGQKLLAHELTHVVQQSNITPSPKIIQRAKIEPSQEEAVYAADIDHLIMRLADFLKQERVYEIEVRNLGGPTAEGRWLVKDILGERELPRLEAYAYLERIARTFGYYEQLFPQWFPPEAREYLLKWQFPRNDLATERISMAMGDLVIWTIHPARVRAYEFEAFRYFPTEKSVYERLLEGRVSERFIDLFYEVLMLDNRDMKILVEDQKTKPSEAREYLNRIYQRGALLLASAIADSFTALGSIGPKWYEGVIDKSMRGVTEKGLELIIAKGTPNIAETLAEVLPEIRKPKTYVDYQARAEAPTNLHAFGPASKPRDPREGFDINLNPDGVTVGPEPNPRSKPPGWPGGASTFGDPDKAPLTGPYHQIGSGTKMKEGLRVVADGPEVSGPSPDETHHTIFPFKKMSFADFVKKFQALGWERAGRKKKKKL
jgi:hypothetical protein